MPPRTPPVERLRVTQAHARTPPSASRPKPKTASRTSAIRMLTLAAGSASRSAGCRRRWRCADSSDGATARPERAGDGQPAGEEADVAVAGEEARAELELGAGELDEPAEPGERTADGHRREQQQPDLEARPGGPPRGCRRRPEPEAPRGRARARASTITAATDGDDDADVHPARRRSAAGARRPAAALVAGWPEPLRSFHRS